MDVRLPDGTVVKNVPDDMTKAQFVSMAIANGYAKSLGGEAPDPTSPGLMGFVEGIGQGLHSIGQGIGQRLGFVSPEEVARTREIDAPLLNTGRGIAGSIIGQAAPAVAASVIPGVNTLAGSAALGGVMGAAQPTVEGEDVGSNMVKSAAFGAGGQMLGKALLAPLMNRNAAPRQALVDTAQSKYGINLPASTRTGNERLAYLESQLAATPGGGRMADTLRRGNEQYAQAVMAEAGAPGQLATTANLATAKQGTQSAYQQLWSQNVVKADNQLIQDLIDAQDFALRTLTPEKARVVERQINNILSKVEPNGTIKGDVYQMYLRPEVRSVASGDSSLKAPAKAVQKALDSAAFRSLQGADVDALKRFNYQYAVQEKIAPKIGDAESRGGTFTPSAVKAAAGDMQGNIGELARIGPLLREPPQSGTAPRLFAQAILTGSPAAYYGSRDGGGAEGAATGGLAGAGFGLLAPLLAARALASPAVQNYIARGLLPTTQNQQAVVNGLLRGLAIPAPMLIEAAE